MIFFLFRFFVSPMSSFPPSIFVAPTSRHQVPAPKRPLPSSLIPLSTGSDSLAVCPGLVAAGTSTLGHVVVVEVGRVKWVSRSMKGVKVSDRGLCDVKWVLGNGGVSRERIEGNRPGFDGNDGENGRSVQGDGLADMLVTAGAEGLVKTWAVRDKEHGGGLGEETVSLECMSVVNVVGEGMEGMVKAEILKPHSTCREIVAVSCSDFSIKICDVENGRVLIDMFSNHSARSNKANVGSATFHTETAFSMEWSYQGDLLLTSCKDRMIRVFDPRTFANYSIAEIMGFDSFFTSRVVWLDGSQEADSIYFLCAGFSKDANRRLAMYDRRNLSEPLDVKIVDQAPIGAPMMFWDDIKSTLCLAGKSDTSIKFFSVAPDRRIAFTNAYKSDVPQIGMSWGAIFDSESDFRWLYKLRKDGAIDTFRLSTFTDAMLSKGTTPWVLPKAEQISDIASNAPYSSPPSMHGVSSIDSEPISPRLLAELLPPIPRSAPPRPPPLRNMSAFVAPMPDYAPPLPSRAPTSGLVPSLERNEIRNAFPGNHSSTSPADSLKAVDPNVPAAPVRMKSLNLNRRSTSMNFVTV